MIEVVGISCEWELRMRAIKRGIIRAKGCAPAFTTVIISGDIADAIQRDTNIIGKVGEGKMFEGVPLCVDRALPNFSVIYNWNEEK